MLSAAVFAAGCYRVLLWCACSAFCWALRASDGVYRPSSTTMMER
jgi:hypothetical protein